MYYKFTKCIYMYQTKNYRNTIAENCGNEALTPVLQQQRIVGMKDCFLAYVTMTTIAENCENEALTPVLCYYDYNSRELWE